jgi:hypothetical protein
VAGLVFYTVIEPGIVGQEQASGVCGPGDVRREMIDIKGMAESYQADCSTRRSQP